MFMLHLSTLQVEQHLQFLKGLASGAHPQAAHWELLLRLTNAMLQSQGWLQRLSERCAQQGVELPEECVIRPPTHPDREGALSRISLPPLGRCVNALAQLGSAANLVSSLGYMAAADGGAGQATRTFGTAGMAAAVESLEGGRSKAVARLAACLPQAKAALNPRERTNAGSGCPRPRLSLQV
mgnify:FL=1|jgi:hypothetical protein